MTNPLRMYWLHALTPLHVGSGQGVGFIDLPVMREKVTDWPVVPGSAVKGVCRDQAETNQAETRQLIKAAFGPRPEEQGERSDDNSGSLVFTDARLVCLPVRSLLGTFAWVTSPLALQRLLRDLEAAGLAEGLPKDFAVATEQVHIPRNGSALKSDDNKAKV